VLDGMSRRAAQFHLTLGEIIRSTDISPQTFLRYKNALLNHMTEVMAELDSYLPRLAAAVAEAESAAGVRDPDVMLRLAAAADERPFLRRDELLDDWRRRWAALRAWFAGDIIADLQPGDLVGRARRGDLGHAVPARRCGQPRGRPAAGQGRRPVACRHVRSRRDG